MSTLEPLDVRRGFDQYLYTAYVLILFSYAATNVLILRTLIVLSSVFFILWGTLNDPLKYQIDTIIYNAIFIIINFYQSIPLFKELLPVYLDEIHSEIYERDFKIYLTKRQYLYFISHFKLEHATAHGTQLLREGNPFTNLIYIARVSGRAKVKLMKGKDTLKLLNAGSWIGIIEYFNRQVNSAPKKNNWGVSADVFIDESASSERKENEINISEEDGVYYFKFDLESLEKLDNDPDYPFVFKNAIQAIWLIYTTHYVIEQDNAVSNNVKVLKRRRTQKIEEQNNFDNQRVSEVPLK